MCGICGIAAADPRQPVDPAIVRAMTSTLRHRGPDGDGHHAAQGVGLGMRRLSIVDLATGDQPIANEDGTLVLVCNGEIYNHVELRAELERKGHRFSTRSDVEPILHLYEERGLDCVDALRGMFAFALWDAPRRRLVLVRDRIGIKPLHYALGPHGLLFGSEAKAILASGLVEAALDPGALHELFTFGFPLAPRTMIGAVRRLPPGHVLVYEDGRASLRKYWDCATVAARTEPARNANEWADALLAELDDAVRLHLRSDVPVGAWLSPGLDSSGIVALICRHAPAPVRTFSLGFEDPDADELRGARTLADFAEYPLASTTDVSPGRDFLRLTDAIWHNEDPSTTGLEVPRLLLSELAGREVKVVLTGEGADELFGGYFWYGLDRVLAPLGVLPRPVRALASAAMRSRWPWAARVLAAPRQLGRERLGAFIGPPAGGLALLTPDLRRAAISASRASAAVEPAPFEMHRTDALRRLDLTTRLPDLVVHNLDRQSMGASLEARVPYLDHRVVELAMRIPPSILLRGGERKDLLRRALARVLPPELARRKKRGMTAPRRGWFRAPLPEFASAALSAERLRDTGYFDAGAVTRLLAVHRAGRTDAADLLLGVLGVQLWDEMFVHGMPRAPERAGAAQPTRAAGARA
ncbi:MAG TPA: asparagine synthase (glutamine-hydrolyzing) [Gemmatimonadaceae bacterium]|nr:asparagine synthase (glutamine-hydrolyzing) [Gemmatimonadaceae bacterium]